jgi:uncharacterized protein YjiS (DUF1127 family)
MRILNQALLMEPFMTEILVHLTHEAVGRATFAAQLMRSFQRALIALSARRTLAALPDGLLRDIGLNRGDIPFVPVALASGEKDSTRDVLDPLEQAAAERGAPDGGLIDNSGLSGFTISRLAEHLPVHAMAALRPIVAGTRRPPDVGNVPKPTCGVQSITT